MHSGTRVWSAKLYWRVSFKRLSGSANRLAPLGPRRLPAHSIDRRPLNGALSKSHTGGDKQTSICNEVAQRLAYVTHSHTALTSGQTHQAFCPLQVRGTPEQRARVSFGCSLACRQVAIIFGPCLSSGVVFCQSQHTARVSHCLCWSARVSQTRLGKMSPAALCSGRSSGQ